MNYGNPSLFIVLRLVIFIITDNQLNLKQKNIC